ncbi:MAG: hypothetical protein OWU33_06885 [Firmicutes bacterium]|nr:hypothetical protein [Bacillota bacterium]
MIEASVKGTTVRLKASSPFIVVGDAATVECEVMGLNGSLTEWEVEFSCEGGLQLRDHGRGSSGAVYAEQAGLGVVRATIQLDGMSTVLTEFLPILSASPPEELTGENEENGLEISMASARLIFPKQSYGYPVGILYVKKDGRWRKTGTTGLVGRAVLAGQGVHPVPLVPISGNTSEHGDRVRLWAQGVSPVVAWKNEPPAHIELTASFELDHKGSAILVNYEAQVDKTVNLRRLEGPSLIVYDEAAERDEGLFPGLEWLTAGESSSSELDVRGPEHVRFSPHPLKMTWPVMAVKMGDIILGWIWNNSDQWNQDDRGYTAEFGSPDTWYGLAPAHRMGLSIPSGSRYRSEENTLLSDTYRWPPHVSLRCSAKLVVLANQSSVLAILDEWVKHFGLPAASVPPFDYGQEWDLARQAYTKSFWDEGHGWGHVLGWPAEVYSQNLFLMKVLSGEIHGPADPEMNRIIETASSWVTAETLAQFNGVHIPGWEPPFLHPDGVDALLVAREKANALVESQGPDGNWVFSPESTAQETLGARGSKAVGLTAIPAETLLSLGRILGDQELLNAGYRALDAMNNFRVPRAAQVWECPVHAPDILAAARALNAYLEGYQLTGRIEFLEQARYWAKAGLPFLYVWETGDRPVMRWASIAIFGATFYEMSWFGRPVQWNGLVFADALLRLAQYDQSFPWREIARGIFHSGMHQQRLVPPGVGGYPDSWYLPDNTPVQGVDINPETLVKVLLRLMGLPATVSTVLLAQRPGVHISAVGNIHVVQDTPAMTELVVSGWQQCHRRMLVSGGGVIKTVQLWSDGQWRRKSDLTSRNGLNWIDWGDGLPASCRVRLEWE